MQLAGEYTYLGALVMDAAVPGPSKVFALFAQLAGNCFACSCHCYYWNSLPSILFTLVIIQSSSASSLKFLLINDGIYTLYSVGVATHLCAVIAYCAFLNCFKQNC